uniref:3-oxoacyl-[acyl-carrier-protein] reductase n=1 Tax=Desulfobacca acetoxidans TaxID=60893 RepID=A0A7V4G749_9BACT
MSQTSRVALVTGAARGIGETIALSLAEPGRFIYINDMLPPEAAQGVVAAVQARGAGAAYLPFDVAEPEQVEEGIGRIIKEQGRLDILVNNAGITRDQLLVRMKPEDWDQVLAVNLKGAFLCLKIAAKPMMKQRFGRVVNISSVVGFMGNAGQANYVASKAGLAGLTRAAARELASRNITVNAVAPGFIETAMTAGLPEKTREVMLAQIPLNRFGAPQEVAYAVAFLVSDQAAYITGQVLHVNGGMLMV